jgi:2-polyprenyl-3-methyl-5-hydroxy-6-metoxy-1,4-benzoquinol methylase
MYKRVSKCRACDNSELQEVFNLGVQPLANDFCFEQQESAGHVPLKVMFCENCTNSQLSVVVDPNIIYRNYPYVTSKSETMQAHFKNLWSEIVKDGAPETVVEIGSNDGLFLKFCKSQGVARRIGVDPAANLIPEPEDGFLPVCSLFNQVAAQDIADNEEKIDVVVARHVFCHINDWHAFIDNIELISNTDTRIFIEVPYVKDMINGFEFDTIYHEHLDYVSVRAMEALLSKTNLHIHRITQFAIHGGAIVFMLRHNSHTDIDESVQRFKDLEYVTLDSWKHFKIGSNRKIFQLKDMIDRARGSVCCGFGASAKSTVWINACGFTKEQVQFICDCTPEKQGKFSPGNDIPIVPESDLLGRMPQFAIMFAWNFKAEILKKNHEYISKGGRFLIPDISIASV